MLSQEISLEVRRFETCEGAEIFRIPLLAFPSLWGCAYLVLFDDGRSKPFRVLIDAGSGYGDSNQHLESGLQAVSSQLGRSLGFADLTHILITHGHIDHFGGLTYVLPKTSAQVGVHELDQRNLTNYEERLTTVARRLKDYFSGDHILSHISPHQSPEQLTLSTGLAHYLKSLDALHSWANGVHLTLPGHEEPVMDLFTRIDEIKQVHRGRLEQVLKLLSQPHTIQDVSIALFGEVRGYNELLALEETGAHIEYLYQRGMLGIDNLEELESGEGSLPIRYRSLPSRVE
jgi:glyoxylase-like metal-dependent hydrolase (beta-lactamase superfamily II)